MNNIRKLLKNLTEGPSPKMKLHIVNIGQDALEDEEFKVFGDFEWLVYSYTAGSYEGDGSLIYKKNGKYYYHSMSHCSCYGPTDQEDVKADAGFDTLAALLTNGTADWNDENEDVMNRAKEIDFYGG